MKFFYRLFVGLTLIGIAFVAYVTKLANDGARIQFDETMAYARWGWLFCMVTGLFAVLFANLYENRNPDVRKRRTHSPRTGTRQHRR